MARCTLAWALLAFGPSGVAGCQEGGPGGSGRGDGGVNAECVAPADCGPGLRCHREACIDADHPIGDVGQGCSFAAHCKTPLVCADRACARPAEAGDGGDRRPEEGAVAEAAGAWPAPEGCALEYPYGFVSLITGRVKVVDLCSCGADGQGGLETILTFQGGHMVTHGVGVDRRRREIWYGNQDRHSVERIRLAADFSTFQVLASIRIPAGLSTIRRSPNGRYVGVGAADPQMVTHVLDEFAKNRAIFIDTGLDRIVGISQQDSPGRVFFSADSERAFVPNINHHNFTVLHMADLAVPSFSERAKVELPWPADKAAGIGPSPFADLSEDGRWFALPGLDAERVFVYDVEAGFEEPWIYETPGERPHMVAWSPAADRLWMVTFTRWPTSSREAENPRIPAYIHVVDAVTHERIHRFQWIPVGDTPVAVWHIEITPDGGMVWVSGSYGSLVGFDPDTYEVRCAVSLESGPRPAMTMDY